jgi:hypothetical protein
VLALRSIDTNSLQEERKQEIKDGLREVEKEGPGLSSGGWSPASLHRGPGSRPCKSMCKLW